LVTIPYYSRYPNTHWFLANPSGSSIWYFWAICSPKWPCSFAPMGSSDPCFYWHSWSIWLCFHSWSPFLRPYFPRWLESPTRA
jgi:hypothetical protein